MHHLRMLTARTVKNGRFSLIMSVLCATLFVLIAGFLIAGCGGGGSSKTARSYLPTSSATTWGFTQVGAQYVGSGQCSNCHASINSQYAHQIMGQNAPAPASYSMSGASKTCYGCHVVGATQTSGFISISATPNLDGIGCEDCHGPGSKHVASHGDIRQITRVPPDKTCWTCHGDRDPTQALPGEIFQPASTVNVNDLTLQSGPLVVNAPHHAAAAFLLGREGYFAGTGITPAMPSPHSTLPNTCLNCHAPGSHALTATGDVDHGLNAFLPANLDRTRPQCASCHTRLSNTPVQLGVTKKLIQLVGETSPGSGVINNPPHGTLPTGGLLAQYYTANGVASASATSQVVQIYKGALYNYDYVYSEGSFGVHNPDFAAILLDNAIAALSSPPAQPAAPTGVVGAVGSGALTISWKAPAGTVTGYRLTRLGYGVVYDGTGTSFRETTGTGLVIGLSYTYTVVAYNTAGSSPPSPPSASIGPVQ